MIIYGSMLCPDCVECRKDLDAEGIQYDYRDFSENLLYLKEFLRIRDENPLFGNIKAEGKIGIPCIIHDDGSISFQWK